ncbi:hypothetical protein NDN08_001768 [Rhodosorus marinus]|uniref:Translation initiation factor 3 N-terminal domain-containing protein n=1 Tax=Rhodosorus marinus TaxID=101924 RepID=A0AAV8URR2_9RHOD|nr:hypothetical protein NDN08_001768 [Rhodosorus marinus]
MALRLRGLFAAAPRSLARVWRSESLLGVFGQKRTLGLASNRLALDLAESRPRGKLVLLREFHSTSPALIKYRKKTPQQKQEEEQKKISLKEDLLDRYKDLTIADLRKYDFRKYPYDEEIPQDEEVRLLIDGEYKGVMTASEALRLVRSEGLNLVQVSLRTGIPLCKGLDFRQYLLNQKIGPEIVEKTKATNLKVKEVRISPAIDQRDMDRLLANGQKFLEALMGVFELLCVHFQRSMDVKVNVHFKPQHRGMYQEGINKLDKAASVLKEFGTIENYKYREIKRDMNGKILFKPLSFMVKCPR